MARTAQRVLVLLIFILSQSILYAQGNKLNIQATAPKKLTVCGSSDTARVTVYNISSSFVTGVTITLNLPSGVLYVPGTVSGTGVAESNITNLNKPVFSGPNLLIARNFTFRYAVSVNCDVIPLLSGTSTPEINVRTDYTGNYDVGTSLPFVPDLPSPGFASITNQSFSGNVGDKFVRRITITNYGKGQLASFRLMRIKGKDLSLRVQTGFSNSYSGDTAFSFIAKSDFTKVGNKDSFLQQNESITIADTFTINGCNSLSTQYEIAWGCNGKWCQIIKNNALAAIGNQSPNLQVVVSQTLVPVYDGTQNTKCTLRVTNIGQMKANRTSVFVFQTYNPGGGFVNSQLSTLDTSTVKVRRGWNGSFLRYYSDTSLVNINTPCVTGGQGGFRIRVPDLNPKDTIFVTWEVERCAYTNCNYGFYDHGWGYKVDYRNQCNTLLTSGNQWGSVYNGSYGGVSTWVPTDIMPGDVKDFRYTFSGTTTLPFHSSAFVRFDVVLPKTLSHSLSANDFYIDNANLTAVWKPDSMKMVGDTLRGFFGRTMRFALTNGELTLRLKGICPSGSGNVNQALQLLFTYNPNTQAHPGLWIKPICNTIYTKVHCRIVCNGGMQFRNFEIYRSNFGLPDNNNDGLADASGSKLDSLKIRKERIMFGDTLTTVFVGRPKSVGTSIRSWQYGYAESNVLYGDYLSVVDARLEIIKGGSVVTGKCNTVRWKKITTGNNARFLFDYTIDSIWRGGCLTSSYRYGQNDSMRLVVRYKVTKNNGGATWPMTFANRYYLASAANPTASQSYQCDTFSGSCILYGSYFHNWGPDNIVYSNCAETWISQSYYLGIGPCCSNYGGGNIFPFEYRNWARPYAIKLTLPNGLKMNRTFFDQYRTAGTNATAYESKDTVRPFSVNGNNYEFRFDKFFKDSGGTFNYSDDGFHGSFYYSVFPSCELPPGVPVNITYDYIYQRRGAMGTGFDTMRSTVMGTSDRFTFNPPTLSLQPALATTYATSDTAEWEVRYSNPTPGFNAYNIWLSSGKNPNIKVVQVRDAVRDTVIKPVNDIYRAGLLAPNQTRRFKIRAVYNSCNKDSLHIYASWNCTGYPADFASYACKANKTTLFLEPQNTRLQVTLSDSAQTLDLCAGNLMRLSVENIQAVNAYNVRVRANLPIGMSIVPGSGLCKFPLNSAAVALSNPTLVSGTTWEWNLSANVSAFSKGLSGTADTGRNKFLLTFRVVTDCDYASGSFISARVLSNIKCGDPVPANPSFTNPLEIKGVTRPYYSLIKGWSDSLLPCEKPAIIKTRVILLGPSSSGATDLAEIFLPPGVSLDTSYWLAGRNAPHKDSVTKRNFAGATLLSWKMAPGITPGDSLEFSIRVNTNNLKVSCGPADVVMRSVVSQKVVCVSTGIPCDIKVITGSVLENPVVDKGELLLLNPVLTTKVLSSDSESVSLKYQVKNNGRYMNSGNATIVNYYFDNDGNGKWSIGDIWLSADTFKQVLLPGAVKSMQRELKVKAGYSCALLAVVDSVACSCKFGQVYFPFPRIENAGRDTIICSGNGWQPGSASVNGFSYAWSPAGFLDDATISRPKFIGLNTGLVPDTVLLILNTNRGKCLSKDSVRVIVNPLPTLKIPLQSFEICQGRFVEPLPSASGGKPAYTWRWAPSTYTDDSTRQYPRLYPVNTTTFSLKVADRNGCNATDTLRVNVNPYPVARFTWPVTCEGADVKVSDSSYITTGTIAQRYWYSTVYDTFGVSSILLPMKGQSFRNLSLIVESNKGCNDTIVRAVDVKTKPTAGFTVNYVCTGDSSSFINGSVIDSGSIVSHDWLFGDGAGSAAINPKHRYAAFGDRNVSLIVKSNHNCSDTFIGQSRVFPVPASAFSKLNACLGDSVSFSGNENLFGDTLKSYLWNLPPFGTASSRNFNYKIGTYGTYPVLFTVETIHGCKSTSADSVTVHPLPKVAWNVSSVCLAQPHQFNNTSSIQKGSVASWQWQFGDGFSNSAKSPTHTYAASGLFTVKLKANSDKGCVDSASGSAKVFAAVWPVIAVNNHCLRERIDITASTRGSGIPALYKWYSGSGDSILGNRFNYQYAQHGNFNVKLVLTTDSGCVRDTTATVIVHPLPQVAFTPVNPCADDSMVFTDNSSIASGTMQPSSWRFTSGHTATASPVRMVFPSPGTFNAILTRTSAFGCKDSAIQSFRIWPKVDVKFTVSPVCEEETSVFNNQSLSPNAISGQLWKFGNSQTSVLANPVHTYRQPGTYNVVLTISTMPGCDYSTTRQAVVHPKPDARFSVDPKQGTILQPQITFTDLSTGADNIGYSMSHGYSTATRNFTYAFPDSGLYSIKQYASTVHGCKDSFSESVYIHYMYTLHMPTAFTPNADGKNEVFGPGGMGISWYDMKIFNRWGQLIYHTDNGKPWDGRYNGELVQEGVYAVLIEVKDFKGKNHYVRSSVHLLR
jgi:gliding motility-associated-like protein